ncbi:MAG: MATE family efflux transporter [Candidatus Cryptobacteroides sp.]
MGGKLSTYTGRDLWRVAWPILLSLVMEQLLGMTDTAFLGRVGEIELGAAALAGVFYTVLYMIGFGFSIGAQILIGQRNGEKRYDKIGPVFYQGLYFLLFLSIVLCGLFELISGPLMNWMVESERVAAACQAYLKWRIPSIFFAYLTCMFRAFYVGTTNTKVLSINSIILVCSNIVLNWILIFGKCGLPAMGIEGAALGSTLSEAISLLFLWIYTGRLKDKEKYGLSGRQPFSFSDLKEIMSLSVWTMVQNCLSIATWFIFFLFVEHTGERALAVSNIIRNTSGFIWMALSAFASTTCTLTSNLVGMKREGEIIPLVSKVLRLTYAILIPVLVLFCIFPKPVLSIYTDIPDLIQDSVRSLWVLCASYLLTIPAFIYFQALSGTGKTKAAFILESFSLVIYTLYCLIAIQILRCDVAIAWVSEAVYALAILLFSSIYLRRHLAFGSDNIRTLP